MKFQSLHISSFEEFGAHEKEIVRRINSVPNGGRLLLMDPIRVLKEAGVHLSDDTVKRWAELAGPGVLRSTNSARLYDAVSRNQSRPTAYTVLGLLRKGKA